ncbi:MAG: amidohydrolase family protein [Gemmatimonadota bacterium]
MSLLLMAGAPVGARAQVSSPTEDDRFALVGGTAYLSPDAAPLNDAIVLVEHGRITAIGTRADTPIPATMRRIDCTGLTITSGFWNSHVHFTQPFWENAAAGNVDSLETHLRMMLLRYGFVRVMDTGSYLMNTLALERRIERGEVRGPMILTTGSGFAAQGGSPYYLRPNRLPEFTSATEADSIVRADIRAGANAIKLFTGSWATESTVVVIPDSEVRAAVAAAHALGKLVFAHPSNSAGVNAAIAGGVDVLAHTFPSMEHDRWDRTIPGRMHRAHMALIPTLKLWKYEALKFGADSAQIAARIGYAQDQLHAFRAEGGDVLFGTDVGYMTDYDTSDEYRYMAGAGMSFRDLLRALTVAPAARLGGGKLSGTLERGGVADITVLAGDPSRDLGAFSQVRYAIGRGRMLYDGTH